MNLKDNSYKLAFAMCLFCFSAACGVVDLEKVRSMPVRTGSEPGSPSPEKVTPGSDPVEAMSAAYRKLFTARSVRSRSVSTLPNGATLTTTTEFVAPDRTRTVIENSLGDRSESIAIGSREFTRKDGKWELSPLDIKVGFEGLHGTDAEFDELMKKAPAPAGNTKLVGPANVNGVQVLVYETTITAPTEKHTIKVSSRVSIGIRDGRLYRLETESTGGIFNTKSLTDFSDYDTDIRIVSPV
jgi:hypothetical protein